MRPKESGVGGTGKKNQMESEGEDDSGILVVNLSDDNGDGSDEEPKPSTSQIRKKRASKAVISSDDGSSNSEGEDCSIMTPRRKVPKRTRKLELDSDDENDDDESTEGEYPSGSSKVTPKKSPKSESETDEEEEDKSNGASENESEDLDSYGSADSFIASDSGTSESEVGEFSLPDVYLTKLDNMKSSGKKKKKSKKRKPRSDTRIGAQEVSIHRIDVKHRLFVKCKTEEDKIDKMVDIYNKGKPCIFKMQVLKKKPEIPVEDVALFKEWGEQYEYEKKFTWRGYIQNVNKQISLWSAFGVNCKSQVIHSLLFLHRKGEIFVLTTGQAWHVIQNYCDLTFADDVAARIFSEEGKHSSTTKEIVGRVAATRKVHKSIIQVNLSELFSYETSCVSEIRKNSSIMSLSCFKSKRTSPPEQEEEIQSPTQSKRSKASGVVKVSKHASGIRIKKRFSPCDFPAIAHYLSIIAKHLPTYYETGEEEKDSTTHKQSLRLINGKDDKKELDIQLTKLIHNAVADDERVKELAAFNLSHQHFIDALIDGVEFSLLYDGEKEDISDGHPPTLHEIVSCLRKYDDFIQVERDATDADYMKMLKQAKLSFTTNKGGGSEPSSSVLKCIEGMLYIDKSDGHHVYWKVLGNWHEVHSNFIWKAHYDALSFLKHHLELPEDVGLKKWVGVSSAKSYMDKFRNEDFTFVSSKPGDDLVDILMLDPNNRQLTVCYILNDMENDFVRRLFDIINYVQDLGKAQYGLDRGTKGYGGTEQSFKKAEVLYRKAEKIRGSFCKNKRDFAVMLGKARVIVAFPKSTDQDRKSIYDEKDISLSLDFRAVKKKLCKAPSLNRKLEHELEPGASASDWIIELLKEHDFLSSEGKVNPKFLLQNRASFSLPEIGNVSKPVYDHLIKPFQPNFCSFYSRLCLLYLKRTLMDLMDDKNFGIVELERIESKD